MITPILKDPRAHGGTLYTFPSASRDMTRAFFNSEYEFAFSNFACLNLPDFRFGGFVDGDNKGMYLDSFWNTGGVDTSIEDIDNLNKCLKWHIQSYVMNYEIALLNGFSFHIPARYSFLVMGLISQNGSMIGRFVSRVR